MSPKISYLDVKYEYQTWKERFIKGCGKNEARVYDVHNDKEVSLSEGLGYGMAIVVYMADKDLFDKLLNYTLARRNSHGLMNWHYEDCSTGDNKKNGAADADLDIAISLVVAYKQWPADKRYEHEATNLIDSIQKYYFTECNGIIVQKPGDYFGGCTCTNPSYFSPAYYRVFAKYAEEHSNKQSTIFWNKAANDAYIPLLKNANPNTGLVYAWTNSDGGNPSDCYYEVKGSGAFNTYQYDACRTPWRIAMDYLWWGNKEAESWLQKITRFVNTPLSIQKDKTGNVWYGAGGIRNVIDGYYQNGLRRIGTDQGDAGQNHSSPFVGSFALASMSSSQADVDECMTELVTLKGSRYYDSCTGLLYKLLATGNFWNPYDVPLK
jgi:endo-1,4-beta-D-glucanase Y